MNSLANMKGQIIELESRKDQLAAEINKAGRQYRFGLWGVLIGIFLIPFYGIGLLPVVVCGLMAFINSNRRSKYRDELENLDARISKLNSSMA